MIIVKFEQLLELIEEERKEQGLSVRRLAEDAGYAPNTYRTGMGNLSYPKYSTLKDFAEVLGLELTIIVTVKEDDEDGD